MGKEKSKTETQQEKLATPVVSDSLLKALNNNRRYIEDKLQNLLNEEKFDEIFEMFEKYFKYKDKIDTMEDDYK